MKNYDNDQDRQGNLLNKDLIDKDPKIFSTGDNLKNFKKQITDPDKILSNKADPNNPLISDILSENGGEDAKPDMIKFNQNDLLNKDLIDKDPKIFSTGDNLKNFKKQITDPDKILSNKADPNNPLINDSLSENGTENAKLDEDEINNSLSGNCGENAKLDEDEINDSLSGNGGEDAKPVKIKFNQDDLLNEDLIDKDPKNFSTDANLENLKKQITDPDKTKHNIPKPDNIKIDNPDKPDNFGNEFNKKNPIIPELLAQNETKNLVQSFPNIGSVALEASLVFVNSGQSRGEVQEIQQEDRPSTKIEIRNAKKPGCIPDNCVIS